ncbi:MAG: hypothetical protein WBG92_16205 [Thiohalocapsa sp.]
MLRAFSVPYIALLMFAGCGSTTPLSVDDEAYRGQLAAAVNPVVSSGTNTLGVGERGRIQSQIVGRLDASGIFASVVPLASRGESNEAETVIEPSVSDGSYGRTGLERVTLRVQARSKSSGEIRFDDRYKGRASRNASAIEDALKDLTKDLKREFDENPVF